MHRTSFFWLLFILATLSWVSWYIILNNVSPNQSPDIAFPLFYATIFFSITFTLALVSSLLWKAIIPTKSSYFCFKNGIREGIILGGGSTIALFFQQYQYLGLKEMVMIGALLLCIEAFFVVQLRGK